MAPPGNQIDVQLLSHLYRESGIAQCKINEVKSKLWRKIAEEYCRRKNIPKLGHKVFSRKWSRLNIRAKKKRSTGQIKTEEETITTPRGVKPESLKSAAWETTGDHHEQDTTDLPPQNEENSAPFPANDDPFAGVYDSSSSQNSEAEHNILILREEKAKTELNIAKMKEKTTAIENFTAQVKRNIAIAQYNQQTGSTLSLPTLYPPKDTD